MSELSFPKDKHLRKIEHTKTGFALLDYPMEWVPGEKPKITTILSVCIDVDENSSAPDILANVCYYDASYTRPERTIFPIDADRGVKVSPRDAGGIIRDCADEAFGVILSKSGDCLERDGVLTVILPDDDGLATAFNEARNKRIEPGRRKQVKLLTYHEH